MRFFHIHNDKFDPTKVAPFMNTMNERAFIKPRLGVSLWGSAMYSDATWLDWDSWVCGRGNVEKYFIFEVDSDKILTVDSLQQWIAFYNDPRFSINVDNVFTGNKSINWKVFSEYYGAFYLTDNGFWESRMPEGRYNELNTYSWDCSAITVFNPDIVKVVEGTPEEKQWIEEKIESLLAEYREYNQD